MDILTKKLHFIVFSEFWPFCNTRKTHQERREKCRSLSPALLAWSLSWRLLFYLFMTSWLLVAISHEHSKFGVLLTISSPAHVIHFTLHQWVRRYRITQIKEEKGESGNILILNEEDYLPVILLQIRLPRWLSGKESLNPWVGKIPWRWKWQLTRVFLSGKFLDRGA